MTFTTTRDTRSTVTTTPPEKRKPRSEWSVAEILEHQRTGQHPVTDDWRTYVAAVAAAAGIDAGDLGLPTADEKPAEDMTAEDFLKSIRRT